MYVANQFMLYLPNSRQSNVWNGAWNGFMEWIHGMDMENIWIYGEHIHMVYILIYETELQR